MTIQPRSGADPQHPEGARISVIYITHDLGVVAKVADYVDVMYAGKIVETGTIDEIFYDPKHPYTWGLLSAMPDLDTADDRLYTIPGSPPNLLHEAGRCLLHPATALPCTSMMKSILPCSRSARPTMRPPGCWTQGPQGGNAAGAGPAHQPHESGCRKIKEAE